MAFENNLYCDFTDTTANAISGKDIILAVFSLDGSNLLAVSGQQSLTINLEKDVVEIDAKTTKGGWRTKLPGMKNWTVENDSLYIPTDESQKVLKASFDNDEMICIKVVNAKKEVALFGGIALVSELSIEAPSDDVATCSLTLEGNGALVDLVEDETATMMPGDTEPTGV